jgi:hypothetical protein
MMREINVLLCGENIRTVDVGRPGGKGLQKEVTKWAARYIIESTGVECKGKRHYNNKPPF